MSIVWTTCNNSIIFAVKIGLNNGHRGKWWNFITRCDRFVGDGASNSRWCNIAYNDRCGVSCDGRSICNRDVGLRGETLTIWKGWRAIG